MMRYASVCDGIGAVHVAWKPLGWECAWTSEIEAFPAAVVEQRHGYRNLGDMTKLTEEQLDGCGPVSLLCGGTPCQSFSVAGLRKGLADPRGNLALRFVQLVGVLRPTWVVWENVPGVLSSAGGRDFGTFLGALGELGYGFAYRVLDAQWFGVAQRRRRVFVVAHARDWRRAAAVLFERESLFGDPPTRGEAGQGTAGGTALRARANSSHRADTQAYVPEVSPALKARDFKGPSSDGDGDGDGASLVPVAQSFYSTESRCDNLPPPDVAPPLKVGSNGGGQPPAVAMPTVAHALRADGFDVSEDGTGRGTPLVPVAFDTTQITSASNYSSPKPGDPCHPLAAGAHPPAIAFDILGTPATNAAKQTDVHVALRSRTPGQSEASTTTVIATELYNGAVDGDVTHSVRVGNGNAMGGVPSVMTPVGIDFQNVAETGDVSGTLMGEAQKKGGEAGHGVIEPVAFAQNQLGEVRTNTDVMGTVNTNQNASGRNTPMVMQAQGFTHSGYSNKPAWITGDRTDCLPSSGHGDTSHQGIGVMTPMAVRRLTPMECERLQGFPDHYTLVSYRGKPAADGPRYKALGNSMAVPVMAWIGRRIAQVEVLP